jgi:hydroxymethylbilane synthase
LTVNRTIRLGTRASDLARWQTEHVARCLEAAWPGLQTEIVVLSTRGDRVLDTPLPLLGGKGAFTAELEAALTEGRIDLAVHSLKDLPTEDSSVLTVGAILERADPGDVLVTRSGARLAQLGEGAAIGTSSRRRAAQILHRYPSLSMLDVRGNVDTRLRKAMEPQGPYDGVVFARAGLERLGLLQPNWEQLEFDLMLPAPGQGALAVQCRAEEEVGQLLAPLDHPVTRACVTAERAFLAGLGGGCSVPVAAHATIEGSRLRLKGRVSGVDGRDQVDVEDAEAPGEARRLGTRLAQDALALGAERLLVNEQ